MLWIWFIATLSVGFFRQEYWRGLPFPSPGDLPDPGIEPVSLISPALAGGFFTTSTTWEAQMKRRKPSISSTSSLNDSLFIKEMIILIKMMLGPAVQLEPIPVSSHSRRVPLTCSSLRLVMCWVQIIVMKTSQEVRLPRTSLVKKRHPPSSAHLPPKWAWSLKKRRVFYLNIFL